MVAVRTHFSEPVWWLKGPHAGTFGIVSNVEANDLEARGLAQRTIGLRDRDLLPPAAPGPWPGQEAEAKTAAAPEPATKPEAAPEPEPGPAPEPERSDKAGTRPAPEPDQGGYVDRELDPQAPAEPPKRKRGRPRKDSYERRDLRARDDDLGL